MELLQLSSFTHCSRKILEKFFIWRPSFGLRCVFRCIVLDTSIQFSIDPGNSDDVTACISNNLVFTSKQRHTAIPIHGQLIQVCHHAVSTKIIWLRIRAELFKTGGVSFLDKNFKTVLFLVGAVLSQCGRASVWRTLIRHVNTPVSAGQYFTMGACAWFGLPITFSNFKAQHSCPRGFKEGDNIPKTLAQIALVFITMQFFPGARILIKIATLSDNAGAEAVSNKLFRTTLPLALFLENLCLLISSLHAEVRWAAFQRETILR